MKERTRILLVEDDKIDQMAFERLIQRENLPYDYEIAGSVAEGKRALASERFDAALIDYLLGDGTAFDLFGETGDTPIVVLTGSGDEAIAVQAMKAGVYDYLIKDPEGNYLKVLPTTVEHAISRWRAEEELRQYREHLEALVAERTAELTQAVTEAKRLNEELQTRTRQQAIVVKLGQRALAGVKLSALMDESTAVIAETLEVGYCKVLELLSDGVTLLLRAGVGWEEGLVGQATVRADAQSQAGYTLLTNDPVIVQDFRTETRFSKPALLCDHEIVSGISVIIHGEERPFGVLDAHTARQRVFTRDDIHFLQAVANVLAEAIRRRRTENERGRYIERLRTLRAIDGAILAARAPAEIALGALRHIRRLVPCLRSSVAVYDLEAREVTVLAAYGSGRAELGAGTRVPLESFGITEELRQGQVRVVEDIAAVSQPSSLQQDLLSMGVHSYASLPLVVHGQLIGELNLGAESPGAFAPEHVDIAREVGDQLAVALQQARLRVAVEAERQRLEALVEHLPEGILLLDGERRILLSNPAADTCLSTLADVSAGDQLTHLTGRPIEELLQPPPADLWHEVAVGAYPRQVFEVIARALDGEKEPKGWVLVIRDVTQEREVQKRTRHQERLAAVGQLAAGVAHDFNNIMGSIVLQAGLLLRSSEMSPGEQERLNIIRQQSHRAADLIRQILDFSRQSVMERQPLDLAPFLKEVVKLLKRTLPENIHFDLTPAGGEQEYVIHADPTRMQQVLMNLAINARDAMPKGGELRIGLERTCVRPGEPSPLPEMKTGEWVRLTVADTGAGIAPEVLAHIFEPFFTTKARGQGTGLGLAQVYGIVQQHEGHIDVDTQVGEGTTFTLYLPALLTPQPVAPTPDMSTLPEGRGEFVLIVEDDARTRSAVTDSLELLGYRVLAAANGREALDVFPSVEKVDLVFTDMIMPGISGADLVRELRETTPDLKAVVITGYASTDELREMKDAGALEIIYKPLDLDTLAQVVRNALDAD